MITKLNKAKKLAWKLFKYCVVLTVIISIALCVVWKSLTNKQRVALRQKTTKCVFLAAQYVWDFNTVEPAMIRSLNLPTFRLNLSKKDVAHLTDIYYKFETAKNGQEYYFKHNQWRKARMEYKGKVYKVKVKAHGRSPGLHRSGRYVSLAIKLKRGDLINNARRFSFIIYPRIQKNAAKVSYITSLFKVFCQDSTQLVNLKINNWDDALFIFEYRFNKAFLERNGHPSWVRFKDGEMKSLVLSTSPPGVNPKDELGDYANKLKAQLALSEIPSFMHKQIFDKYMSLNSLVASGASDGLEKYFDEEYIASFEAARLLAGYPGHGIQTNNLIMFYDTSSGLFFPAMHRDYFHEIHLSERNQKSVEAATYIPSFSTHYLTSVLCRNESIRQNKYRKIWNFVSDENALQVAHEKYWQINYHDYYWKHPFFLNFLRSTFSKKSNSLKGTPLHRSFAVNENAKYLRKYLSDADPEFILKSTDDGILLEVYPNSVSALKFLSIPFTSTNTLSADIKVAITDVNGKLHLIKSFSQEYVGEEHNLAQGLDEIFMSDGFGQDLTRFARSYTFLFKFKNAPGNIDFKNAFLQNTVTKKTIKWNPINKPINSGALQFLTNCKQPALAKEGHKPFVAQGGALVLPAGKHIVRNSLILPLRKKVIIQGGAELLLGKNISIICSGDLNISGTKESPVIIAALNSEEPFGSFAALGNSKTSCIISNLQISNGSEAMLDGVYYSGALSLYYHKQVDISNSTISNNRADDGLNIKNAKVSLRGNTFFNNAADQVDLDACVGSVIKNKFLTTLSLNSNGDGLDVSLSEIHATDNMFSGFQDKGVSIGENSKMLLENNVIEKCNLGIAAKDESKCIVQGNVFTNNKIDIFAYRKKISIWKGSFVYVPSRNLKKRKCFVDDKSSFRFFDIAPSLDMKLDDKFNHIIENSQPLKNIQFKEYLAH